MLAPHTTMCMGVESFTDKNRSPLHLGTYISLLDVTVPKVTPVILHRVVSPEIPLYGQLSAQAIPRK